MDPGGDLGYDASSGYVEERCEVVTRGARSGPTVKERGQAADVRRLHSGDAAAAATGLDGDPASVRLVADLALDISTARSRTLWA